MTNLDNINEDCLRMIIKFLNFRDQVILAQVSQRFESLIEHDWILKCSCRSINLTDYFWLKIEENFPKFIRLVCCLIEEIELSTYHLERWGTLLRNLKFCNLKYCTANLSQSHTNTDDQVSLLAECFPKLEKLTLRGHSTGKNIWKLTCLKVLHFDMNDVQLKSEHVRQFYKKLSIKKLTLFSENHMTSCGFLKAIEPLYLCDSLEELRIAGDVMHRSILKIKKVKSLRKLTAGVLSSFRFIPYPLEDIGECFGSEVESIIFNHVIRNRADHLKGMDNMKNLRKIVLYDDSITSDQIQQISLRLKYTLEEFYYLKCGRSIEDVEKFITLIRNCTLLKILDVSGSSVDINLIFRVSEFLNKNEREQPLQLICGNTKIIPSDLQGLRLPNSLSISFDMHDVELPEEYFFQVTFKGHAF